MKQFLDILYKEVDGISLYLDLFMPDADHPPLILWIHGGAWMVGDRKSPILRWQVERGYALASIEYRLSGQGTFPANIIDCKDALVYLKAQAAEYGYDSGRIAVAGDSAGGHLAALMGTSVGHADWEPAGSDCSVQAVVDYYGPTQVATGWPDASHDDSPESMMLGAPVKTMKGLALAAAANPITYINGTEPPFLILHGDADDVVPFEQSVMLFDALHRAGSPVSLNRVWGGGHGFDNHAANEVICDFLDRHLK